MMRTPHNRGQSLMEAVFAIAILIMGLAASSYLLVDAHVSLTDRTDRLAARSLALEGLVGVRALAADDFSLLASGTYSIALANAAWHLAAPTTEGDMVRTIAIEDIDPEVRRVTSEVSWGEDRDRPRSIALETFVGNWRMVAGESAALVITYEATTFASGTTDFSITLENSGDVDIEIVDVVFEFLGDAVITAIEAQGEVVYATEEGAHAGESIAVPMTIGPHTEVPVRVRALGQIEGDSVLATVTAHDDSYRYIRLPLAP